MNKNKHCIRFVDTYIVEYDISIQLTTELVNVFRSAYTDAWVAAGSGDTFTDYFKSFTHRCSYETKFRSLVITFSKLTALMI